jgi:hypothetical protein
MIAHTHYLILFNSLQVGYLKYEFRETCQENETLWFQMMVMSGSHDLATISEINHAKILPQDILHNNFTHDHHSFVDSFQYFYISHCIYHDKIEAWLEESFRARFPVNNNVLILHMLDIGLDILNFSSCSLLLIQFLLLICVVHMIAGLKLHEWLHWKFDFT